jgi:PPOX class probable F420-dependent enzyme
MAAPTSGPGTPSSIIDTATDVGARAARHLRSDAVVWLTTVAPSGAPSPNPVWFLWDGGITVQIHSLPEAARVRHLRTNPRVALHFDSDENGEHIVVLSGRAELRPDDPAADTVPAYLAKYRDHILRIGHTPASFAAQYSQPIVVTLTGLRGF